VANNLWSQEFQSRITGLVVLEDNLINDATLGDTRCIALFSSCWIQLGPDYSGPRGWDEMAANWAIPRRPCNRRRWRSWRSQYLLLRCCIAGGIFKSTNGGLSWTPTFDHESISSIGAIAVADSDPNVLYAGSGEACLRGNISYGDGVYKSTDAGRTWKNVGIKDTRHIGAVVIDPRNPDVALIAALGHSWGLNAERGVFRTADGGKTWQKVLYKDENTGAIDVVFDPRNSSVVYAALWQVRRALVLQKRRAWQRSLQVCRWRPDVEATAGQRPARRQLGPHRHFRFAIGLRNSHDKFFRLSCTVGLSLCLREPYVPRRIVSVEWKVRRCFP